MLPSVPWLRTSCCVASLDLGLHVAQRPLMSCVKFALLTTHCGVYIAICTWWQSTSGFSKIRLSVFLVRVTVQKVELGILFCSWIHIVCFPRPQGPSIFMSSNMGYKALRCIAIEFKKKSQIFFPCNCKPGLPKAGRWNSIEFQPAEIFNLPICSSQVAASQRVERFLW